MQAGLEQSNEVGLASYLFSFLGIMAVGGRGGGVGGEGALSRIHREELYR